MSSLFLTACPTCLTNSTNSWHGTLLSLVPRPSALRGEAWYSLHTHASAVSYALSSLRQEYSRTTTGGLTGVVSRLFVWFPTDYGKSVCYTNSCLSCLIPSLNAPVLPLWNRAHHLYPCVIDGRLSQQPSTMSRSCSGNKGVDKKFLVNVKDRLLMVAPGTSSEKLLCA